jgi:hypothetical protein
MDKPRVFADFHNADAQGRLRLNCTGTIEDLARQKIWLRDGQELTFICFTDLSNILSSHSMRKISTFSMTRIVNY